MFHRHFKTAIKSYPEIIDQARNPNAHANIYIGSDSSDVRVMSFFRRGSKLFLPLPYIKNCPREAEVLRQKLLKEHYERIIRRNTDLEP